ncbi:3-hydroxyisobutyrate dehydrogenase [Methylopila turkensis]|uniref:3-hydroxyisobutyrate dehydrogenase n=1 Tax=Methylopila turkensis TaxID=1437816 RepID=A0A9W6JNA2_9HYPH|nr:3-hydroxyisobutyrate dehydrogenase [Methylopila turkensis]GLK79521.1 3-hydroxyisobutyrate dehydrogenase [Methylopila turkensis]
MAKIGFIGLGNMGAPMAANAVRAGHAVHGYDIAAARCAEAAAHGVEIAADVGDAASGADIVVTMLNAGATVVDVWTRVAPRLAPGALMIDSSTIDVDSARRAHAVAAEAGLLSLDAPVSGGVEGATAGTLTFMVGGSDEAFAKGQPLLAVMGRRIVHCGGAGAGDAAKICNNMILGVSMIAVSEAFILGESLGLSRQALFDVASNASGQCYALTTHCPVPGPVPGSAANRDYRPGFAAELMAKDLRLSQDCARSSGAPTPIGAAASALYERFVDAGGRGVDYAGVIRFIREMEEQERAPIAKAGE